MMTTRPVKARTVVTRFKNEEGITIEMIGEEYGIMDNERFFEILKESLGKQEFSKLLRANEKRKKVKEKTKKEETTMKARLPKDESQETVVVTGTLPQKEEKLTFQDELKMRKLLGDNMPMANDESTTATESNEVTEPVITKEENNMVEVVENKAQETQELPLEKLQERKTILETQIESKKGKKESQAILLQIAEQERNEVGERVDSLKKQLAQAEDELLEKECAIEDINHKIEEIEAKEAEYRKELAAVEEEIKKATVVFLAIPSFKGQMVKGMRYVVSDFHYKKDGKTIDDRFIVEKPSSEDDFGISALQARKLGYKDLDKFFEDCAFVVLVRDYKEAGKPYEVKTFKSATINNLLDKVFGEGEW